MHFIRFGHKLLAALAVLLVTIGLGSVPASAQTVTEIVERGVVRIGVTVGAPPFGTIDLQGNPAGYDTDVALLLARYLGVPAELVPVTPASRIAALEAGKVDLLVATLAPTPERAKSLMFTAPYSVFRGGLYAPVSTAIEGWDDIAGMRVGVNRGSSIEGELTSRQEALGLDVVLFEDNATGIQALFSGQLDAWLDADSIAAPALNARPDANVEAKFFFINQPNSMTVRKDAFELHQWLNNFIYFIRNSGELSAISEKWLGGPLPADLPVF